MPKYDVTGMIAELCRMLEVGKPTLDESMLAQLQQLAMVGKQALAAQQAAAGGPGGAAPTGNGSAPKETPKSSQGGPNASEGEGPKQGNLAAGAARGTFPVNAGQ